MQLYETEVSRGHGALEAGYLVIHETANPGATAYDHLSYWAREDRYAVHYVTDWRGRVYHCVPDDRLCWHVGNGNKYCVGIELCHATNQEDFDAVWQTAVEFAAYYLGEMCWTVDENLISHDDARRMWGGTDHTDPIGYFAEYGRTWGEFKAEVKALMEKEEPEVITNEDVTSIAKACANYVWGFEKQGQSAINRLMYTPSQTAVETLGYTNKNMNGNRDVYQLITDARQASTDVSKKLDVLIESMDAMAAAITRLEEKIL